MTNDSNDKDNAVKCYAGTGDEEKETEHNKQAKENKPSFGMKAFVFITVMTVIVSLGYTGIKKFYPLSQGQVFRLWFARTLPVTLLALLQCFVLIWICVLSGFIKSHQKKNLLKRIAVWITGIIVIFAMAFRTLEYMLNDDSEHYNENGTITIESPVWLDGPEFALYQKENFLVLQYLRESDGLQDTDPLISREEYNRRKMQKELEKEGNYQKETEHESVSDHKTDQDIQEAERNRRIEEGYHKIYENFLEVDGDQYKKDYNAKGNSYIIVCEDETQIRYLMYDRDDDYGTKARYVYFQNKKNSDGSWSPTDSEILDMYQYDYESKEVKDLEKTTW